MSENQDFVIENGVLTPVQAAQCLMTQSTKGWQETVWRNTTAENAQEVAEALVELCASKKQKNKARDARLVEFLARYGCHVKKETADALKAVLTTAEDISPKEWVIQDAVVTGTAKAFRDKTLPDFVLVATDRSSPCWGRTAAARPP